MDQRATLLVVEDDVHLLQGIRDILEIEGYKVRTAASGIDGLEVLEEMQKPPDLIISDIMMPRMDGYQFFDAVRRSERWVGVPFVFLTAKGEKHDLRLGRRLGVDDYVVKPMEPEDLLIIVKAKLERHRVLQDLYTDQVRKIKRSILTIINHEFRTPLTYMVAYSDMLISEVEHLDPEELRSFLRGVNNGADRFRRLVENFIALVELDTGEAQQNYNWRSGPMTDIRPICQEIMDVSRLFAEDSGVELIMNVPAQVPEFTGDEEYLRTALAQLIENGIKFSSGAPVKRVELRAHAEGDCLRLAVQDWGRGIEQEEFNKIWDPFYQIDRTQFEDQGAGSGLAIVRGIIELHGGRVDLESAPGKGSTFTVILPLN